MRFAPYIVHGYWMVQALCLVISAKWTRELGYGIVWQIVLAICGFILGPIMPLLIYLRGFFRRKGEPQTAASL